MPDNRLQRGFYQEYSEQRSREKQDQQLREQYHITNQQPLIIQNASTSVRFLSWLADTAWTIGKILLYILLFGLASIGLTTILNSPIREVLFQTLQGFI